MQQLWTPLLNATTEKAPFMQASQQQRQRLSNAENAMPCLINYCFQPVAIDTTGGYGKTTAPFLSGLIKKLVL